jgi:hypothetical protein
MRVTGQDPRECPGCAGFGYNERCATEMEQDNEGKLRTVQQGSGCLRCGGTGRLEELALKPRG